MSDSSNYQQSGTKRFGEPNDTTTDQIELLAATLKALQASTGAELTKFTFTPHFIGANLTKVDVKLTFDPMVEEE